MWIVSYRALWIGVLVTLVGCFAANAALAGDRIQPHPENPRYWQYQGKPLLLLGGSWQDNLFNHPTNLEEHLDLLTAAGGNYVRNVMSHRNRGNAFAYTRDADGKFDLDSFNDEYWQRLENFLKLTHERGIVVQVEIWATWDHYEDHQSLGGWSHHPFNPANNRTYTAEESGLPTEVDYPPAEQPTEHPFFHTVPALDDNTLLLGYQRAFVDKLLSITLDYPHVLYCMNNETGEPVEWGDYWIRHVRQRAEEAGVTIYTTDMRRSEDVTTDDHAYIYDNPDRYTFLDISQNTAYAGRGQGHYDNMMHVRERTADEPRPINTVKNYGASRYGEDESVARFARIIFAGGASARYHRPHPLEDPADHEEASRTGLGLSSRAQATIQSLRMVTDELEILAAEPRNDLLSDREENEAYLLAKVGETYAVYFPKGGSVAVDLSDTEGDFSLRWINLDASTWTEPTPIAAAAAAELTAPGEGHWVALIAR